MEKPFRIRFEDRTRWAPMTLLADTHSRPVPYLELSAENRRIVGEVTSVIYRMVTHKDLL